MNKGGTSARAVSSGGRGRRFESSRSDQYLGGIARTIPPVIPPVKTLWAVLIYAALTLISAPAQAQYITIPDNPTAIVVSQPLNFPCWHCLAIESQGGGKYGATASILDLHVISSRDDVSFPRALVARIESWCQICQPAALTAQARGMVSDGTVWAANFETYGLGRGTVLELNMGTALGGYVLDVVPTRLASGAPSRIDAVLKVEGFGNDPTAAKVDRYIDARINPTTALIVIPSDQGPVTVMQTSDGRMKETWQKDIDGNWTRTLWIDGVPQ